MLAKLRYPLLGTLLAASPVVWGNSAINSASPVGAAPAVTPPAQPDAVAVENVCFYDLQSGAGAVTQIPPITAAGHTAVNISALDAPTLAGCDVLFAQNGDNGGFAAAWVTGLAAVQARVQAGMALVLHDRNVEVASANVPGLAATTCTRDTGADAVNIEIVTNNTVVNGPGGVLNATSLDGGNFSSHGFCTAASLPLGSTNVLSRTVSTESTAFAYPLGLGCVYYSTMPLDFYLAGNGNNPPRDNFNNIYAPNVVAYATANCNFAAVPVLPAGVLATLAGGLLALGGLALQRRR